MARITKHQEKEADFYKVQQPLAPHCAADLSSKRYSRDYVGSFVDNENTVFWTLTLPILCHRGPGRP